MMIRLMATAVALVVSELTFCAPPPYVSQIGSSSPKSGTGAPGFTSMFQSAEAYTPGLRSSGRGAKGGGRGTGAFSGGRFGGATGYGRNGVRPPIPTPPTSLGGYRGGPRR